MKKNILLLSFIILGLTSCSSDEVQQVPDVNGTKLKRIKTSIDGGRTYVNTDFLYNGNKLSKEILSNNNYYKFTYTGDLITKVEHFGNNGVDHIAVYEYNADNKLVSRTDTYNNPVVNIVGSKTIFTHNNNGTISISSYSGDDVNQMTQTDLDKKVFFENGLVSKIEEYKMINGNLMTNTESYTYDTAITPFSSIIGMDKLTDYDRGKLGQIHNVTSIAYVFTTINVLPYSVIIDNMYNTNNCLSKATYTNSNQMPNGPSTIVKYYYQ